ncbi:MinD/ParA family protein [Streptomyces sp. SID6673]|nr:MinD/ParA family protein [Streptomyces sp. SID11726]NEB25118.1 MinD/ParA family protein [Streptomyces sp. SID6673]
MTYDDSRSVDDSGVPAPPPWLQFAEPEPPAAPEPAPHEQSAYPSAAEPMRQDVPAGPTRADHRDPRSDHQATADRGVGQPEQTTGLPTAESGAWPADGAATQRPPGGMPQAPGLPPRGAPAQYPPPAPPQQNHPPQMPPGGPVPAPPFGPGAPYGGPFGGPPMGAPGYGDPQAGPGLDEVALIRKARRAPSRGWRRAVHTMSAGAINPGESPADIEYQHLLDRVNRPVRGDYRIAVLSLKGGVGKTTTTVGLGSTFASLRGDRVIAVDANPDLGTLAQRIPQQTRSTVRDLLADPNVYRYSDVRAHTSQSPSRLEVLASERDPAMAEAFSDEEYRGVMRILQRFYNIIITDCGTGLSHSAMNGVLDMANSIILVSSPAMDGARSAGATLDWLEAHGYGRLASRAVVVLSSSRPGASTIDTDQLGQHFLTRCRAVHQVPFDDHLSEGADVDLDLVSKQTRRAFAELAATIADDFASASSEREEPFYP